MATRGRVGWTVHEEEAGEEQGRLRTYEVRTDWLLLLRTPVLRTKYALVVNPAGRIIKVPLAFSFYPAGVGSHVCWDLVGVWTSAEGPRAESEPYGVRSTDALIRGGFARRPLSASHWKSSTSFVERHLDMHVCMSHRTGSERTIWAHVSECLWPAWISATGSTSLDPCCAQRLSPSCIGS